MYNDSGLSGLGMMLYLFLHSYNSPQNCSEYKSYSGICYSCYFNSKGILKHLFFFTVVPRAPEGEGEVGLVRGRVRDIEYRVVGFRVLGL